jgi:hypothetical protein
VFVAGVASLAIIVQVVASIMAARDREMPSWVPVVGPVLIVQALVFEFSKFAPHSQARDFAEAYMGSAPYGWVLLILGVVSFLAALAPLAFKVGGKGSMALAQMGALCAALGLFWVPFMTYYAGLWALASAEPEMILQAQENGSNWFMPWAAAALGVVAAFFLPTALWGLLRIRLSGLGSLAAAFVLVGFGAIGVWQVINSVNDIETRWGSACEVQAYVGVKVPAGDMEPGSRPLVRRAEGGLEWFKNGVWVPFLPLGPVDVVWFAPEHQSLSSLAQDVAMLPPKSDIIIAGMGERPQNLPFFFQRHPAVRSSWCRGNQWPIEGVKSHFSISRAAEELERRRR